MTANGRIRPLRPVLISILLALFVSGCSSSPEDTGLSLVDPNGNHPSGWITAHPGVALPDGSLCVSCHGSVTSAAESGGISGVSCFLASRNGQGCHVNGPSFTGIHAVPYLDNVHFMADVDRFTAECSLCHALNPPSPLATAPPCMTCHTAGSPLTFLNCSSCHSEPPAGDAYPNIAGGHGLHNAFTGVTGVCSTCHDGLGSGTPAHYNRANARPGRDALRVPPGDVALLSNFDAKSGQASFDNVALTCLNVSCHGGQTTPNWQTGEIDPNTDCLLCHTGGTTQFNGFFSGEHNLHVALFPFLGIDPPCVGCHNTVALADQGAHFDNLVTTAIDTRADVTIGGGTTFVLTYDAGGTAGTGSCMPTNSSADVPQCHGTRSW